MSDDTLRKFAFDHLQKSIQVIGYIVSSIAPAAASTYRDGGTGWTVREILGHLNDFEAIFLPSNP